MVVLEMWGCPEGYHLILEECYRLFKEDLTYPEAEVNCEKQGGTLADPKTFLQSEVLESIIDVDSPDQDLSVWIKLRKEDLDDGTFFGVMTGLCFLICQP